MQKKVLFCTLDDSKRINISSAVLIVCSASMFQQSASFSLNLSGRRIRMARCGSRTTVLKAITELFHQHSSIGWATNEWESVSSSTTKTSMRRQVEKRQLRNLILSDVILAKAFTLIRWFVCFQQGWMYAMVRIETPASCTSASRALVLMSSSTMTRHVRRWNIFS